MISMKNLRSLRYFNLKFLMFLFFILNLFFNFSVIIHAQSNYYEIILPKKVNGIESVQYYIDGTPKGSTDGTNSIKIKENSKINFSVKFEGSGYNQTKLEDLKLRNSSNNIIKFNIYTKDENNNIILSEVDKNEFINPEQEYISSEVTINSDNKFYFSNLKQDLYDINIYSVLENITKNLDIKYRVITENNINNPGDFNSNCTFNTNNKSFQVTGVLPDSTVELLITPDKAYSQSNFKVFNNNQEIQPDKNIYRIININSNLNININNLEKNKYNVNFADNNLSLISDSNQIIHGENFEFTYNSMIPENQVVTANNIIIKPDENNIYKIKNIREDQEIKLTSKDEAVHMISFENISDYYNITDINDNIIDKLEVKDGASASFKLELKDAYSGSLGQDEILSEVLYNNNNNNHKIIYESGFYKINNITSSLNIYAEGLQKNKYILKLGGDLENITSYNITINNSNIISNHNTIEIEHGDTIEIDFEVQNGYETSHTYISTYPKIEAITGSGNNFVINNITSDLFVNINKIYKISTENEDIKIYTTPKIQKTHNNKIKYNLSSDINLNNNIIDQIAGSIDFSRLNIFSGISELENTIQNTENLDLLKENYNQEQIIKDQEKENNSEKKSEIDSEDYNEQKITETLKFKIPNDSVGAESENVVHAAEIAYAAAPNIIYTSDNKQNDMKWNGFTQKVSEVLTVYHILGKENWYKKADWCTSEYVEQMGYNSSDSRWTQVHWPAMKNGRPSNNYAYVVVPKNGYHFVKIVRAKGDCNIVPIQQFYKTTNITFELQNAWVLTNVENDDEVSVELCPKGKRMHFSGIPSPYWASTIMDVYHLKNWNLNGKNFCASSFEDNLNSGNLMKLKPIDEEEDYVPLVKNENGHVYIAVPREGYNFNLSSNKCNVTRTTEHSRTKSNVSATMQNAWIIEDVTEGENITTNMNIVKWKDVDSASSFFDVYYLKNWNVDGKRWNEWGVSELTDKKQLVSRSSKHSNTLLMEDHDHYSAYIVVPKKDKHFWLRKDTGSANIRHASLDGDINKLHEDFYEAWIIDNIGFDETINVDTNLFKVTLDGSGLCGMDSGGTFCSIRHIQGHSNYGGGWYETLNDNILKIKMDNGLPVINELHLSKDIPATINSYDLDCYYFNTDIKTNMMHVFRESGSAFPSGRVGPGYLDASNTHIKFYRPINKISMRLDEGDFETAGLYNKANFACLWQSGENVLSLDAFRSSLGIDDYTYYKTSINNFTSNNEVCYGEEEINLTVAPYSDDFYGITRIDVMCRDKQIDVMSIDDDYQLGTSVESANSVFGFSRTDSENNAMNITFRKDKYLELVAANRIAYDDPVFVIHPGGPKYEKIQDQLFIKYETSSMLKNAKVINPNIIVKTDGKEKTLTFTGGIANCTESLFGKKSNGSYKHDVYNITDTNEYVKDGKLYVLIEAATEYEKCGTPTVEMPGVTLYTTVACTESIQYEDKNGDIQTLNVNSAGHIEGIVLELDLEYLGYWTSIGIGDTWIKPKTVNLYFLDSPGTEFRHCYPSRDANDPTGKYNPGNKLVGGPLTNLTDLPLDLSYGFFLIRSDPRYDISYTVRCESETGQTFSITPSDNVRRSFPWSGKLTTCQSVLGAHFRFYGVNNYTLPMAEGETSNADGTTTAKPIEDANYTFGPACDGYARVGHPTQNLYFSVYRERSPINIKFPTNLVGINLIDSADNTIYSNYGNYSTTKTIISFNIVPVPGYEMPDNAVVSLTDSEGRMTRVPEHNGRYILIDPPDGSTVNVDYTPKLSNFDLYFTPYEGVEYLDENRNPIGSDKTSVEYGGSKSFIVNLDNTSYFSGSIENLEVTAVSETFSNTLNARTENVGGNNPYLTDDGNGLYTIHNIDDNYRILISGLEVNTYTVEFLPFEDITYYNQYGTEVLKNETVEIQNISEDSNVTENEISGKEEQNPDSDKNETNDNIKIIVPYNSSLGFKVIPNEGVDDSNIVVWCLTEDELGSETNAEKLTPTGDNTYFINNISQDCKIRVENTKKLEYKVTLRPAEGVSYVSSENEILKDDVTVSYGDNLEFGLVFAEDYNKSIPKVYIKGTETELSKNKDNLYVLENITENKTIEVLGVSKNTYTVRFEDTEGVIYKTMKNKPFEGSLESEYGEDLQFMITLMDAYNKSVPTVMLNNSEIISENGGIYTVEKISDDTVISVKDIVKNPEELTIEDILSIPDQITSSTDVNKVISATKSYDSLSDEDKIFVINSGELEKAQESCKSINHISDNITVTGLDWNLKLLVTDLSYDKELIESLNQELDRKTLLSLYDIKLINLFDNQEYEIPYGQEVTVVIPHVNTSGYENIVVVHKNSGGGIEYLNADVSEDNIQFKTSSFSQFGVAGKKIPNYVEDPSEITISVADLVTDTDELQTLLGEGLSSQLGEIINIDNTGSNTISSGSKNNNITENNSNWANKIYTWLINNELTAVILVIFIGFLIISLMWFFGTQNKNQD